MTLNRLLIPIIMIASAAFIYSACDSEQDRISRTVREHLQPGLQQGETFNFIGLSNRRDTTFMGVHRPCAGVIYTLVDAETGEETRHFADVIFTDDYRTALSVTELDFDPIEYAEEKIKDAFKEKLHGKLSK